MKSEKSIDTTATREKGTEILIDYKQRYIRGSNDVENLYIYILVFTGRELIFFIAAHVMLFQIYDQMSVDNTPGF